VKIVSSPLPPPSLKQIEDILQEERYEIPLEIVKIVSPATSLKQLEDILQEERYEIPLEIVKIVSSPFVEGLQLC
jgi:hypothetical protein